MKDFVGVVGAAMLGMTIFAVIVVLTYQGNKIRCNPWELNEKTTIQELRMRCGEPRKINRSMFAGGTVTEQWVYDKNVYLFVDAKGFSSAQW